MSVHGHAVASATLGLGRNGVYVTVASQADIWLQRNENCDLKMQKVSFHGKGFKVLD